MPTNVHRRFEDDEHREAVVEHLRGLETLPDAELLEDDEGVRLALDTDDSTRR